MIDKPCLTLKYVPRTKIEGRWNLVKHIYSIKAEGYPRMFISASHQWGLVANFYNYERGRAYALNKYCTRFGVNLNDFSLFDSILGVTDVKN